VDLTSSVMVMMGDWGCAGRTIAVVVGGLESFDVGSWMRLALLLPKRKSQVRASVVVDFNLIFTSFKVQSCHLHIQSIAEEHTVAK
jgi:hypothetical protein